MATFPRALTRNTWQNWMHPYYKDEDWSPRNADCNINKKLRSQPHKWRQCSVSKTLKLISRELKLEPITLKQKSDAGTLNKKVKLCPAKKRINHGISEYELQVQKNIAEQKKCFNVLQLDAAKQELLDLLSKSM